MGRARLLGPRRQLPGAGHGLLQLRLDRVAARGPRRRKRADDAARLLRPRQHHSRRRQPGVWRQRLHANAPRAARRERERLDALAEEEKKNRERDDASDVRAQAKRALEEKKRREAERASAEREARSAAREAQKREEKQRREEEKKRREAEKAEERERRLADAARRRAEAEVIAREEAAAALEAEAEREARRALAAETRETLKAQRELKRRAERASASTSSPSREVLDGLGDERGAYESTPSKAVVSGASDGAPGLGESPGGDSPGGDSPPVVATRAGSQPHIRTVALVPGRWIDPGEDAGAPGERALNLVIANRAHVMLGDGGWTVLRPDLASPPLAREQYADFVRAQTLAGVPVLEIHGAAGDGRGDEGRGVTGVIAQDDSALGAELSKTFGAGPSVTASRRDLELINQGAVAVESFDAAELEAMDPVARSARVDAIARDIASAVGAIGDAAPPEGCSASGCPRRRDDDP